MTNYPSLFSFPPGSGLVLCLLLTACLAPRAQEPAAGYTLLTTIPVETRFFTTDKLQQVYAVTPTNELIKYDAKGTELFRFNNNTQGELGWVDATDPFNVLLYYPDFQVAITLDRTLSITSETNLWAFDLVNVQAVGTSLDNQLWIYDDQSFQLKKIDRSGQVLAESNNLNLILPTAPRPVSIQARENRVYVNDPEMGILVFDNFGQYIRLLDLKGLAHFQVWQDRLFYQQDTTLLAYDLRSFLTTQMALPEGVKATDQVRLQRELLFVRKGEGIEVWRMGE